MHTPNLLQSLTDNIVIDKNKCLYCGLCAERCILDNIRLKQAPCSAACPMGLNVQGYVQLVARGRDDAARDMIRNTLPFPKIICRICEQPCQKACHRSSVDKHAVNINGLKRFLFANTPEVEPMCASPTGRNVAIVGAGPAGLLAAYDVALAGHTVTVYDAAKKPGGLLRSLLPLWKLPEQVLDDELAVLKTMGITFVAEHPIATPAVLNELQKNYDAVMLCTGAGTARHLNIPGSETSGVIQAFELLQEARCGNARLLQGRVLVVGGGRVALDAAQTAIRQGAEKVTIVYRRTREQFRADAEDICAAQSLGIDFAYTWNPVRIARSGNMLNLTVHHNMDMLPEGCRDYPDFDPAEERVLCAEHILVAIGQSEEQDVAMLTGKKNTFCDPITLQLDDESLFVAGDALLGASSAIHAMASGRKAALSVVRLLAGANLHYERCGAAPVVTDFHIDTSVARDVPPQKAQGHKCAGAGDYSAVCPTYDAEQARKEASRCLSCGGPEGYYRTCWFCLPCEVECPEKALCVEVPYLLR